jgi:putative transposase
MPFVNVYVHFVWTTKYREQLLSNKRMRYKVWQYIRNNAKEHKIHVDHISGYSDHCHCLVSLSPNQSLGDVMKQIKGESSHWINENRHLFPELGDITFEWQDGYFASAVSPSMIARTRQYIKNQEEHHLQVSFEDEYKEVLNKNGFDNPVSKSNEN